MRHLPSILAIACIVLAGCADGPAAANDGPALDVTATTGGIRGVVLDQTITPLPGATVVLAGTEHRTTSGPEGLFNFTGLAPGTYFLQATHPLYDSQQSATQVVAGQADPPLVKIQLTRVITQDPYTQVLHLKGYIVCSSNAGGIIAEECGEGVGVPCEVPVFGCQRVGGTPDNVPEVTFYTDGNHIRTIQAEVVWEPSFQVSGEVQSGGFTVIMAVNHVCDPVCRYDSRIDDKVGQSPMIMRTDDGPQGGGYFGGEDTSLADANITAQDSISVFVWQTDQDAAGVTFDQPFDVFVTLSYYLPLPEDYRLSEGHTPPW